MHEDKSCVVGLSTANEYFPVFHSCSFLFFIFSFTPAVVIILDNPLFYVLEWKLDFFLYGNLLKNVKRKIWVSLVYEF